MSTKGKFDDIATIFFGMHNNSYEQAYVAFIDILGFSSMVNNSKKPSDMADLFMALQFIKRNAVAKGKLKLIRFSDSIFIVAPIDAFTDLIEFLSCCAYGLLVLSQQGPTLDGDIKETMKCCLLRGGVTYGDVFSLRKYLSEKNEDTTTELDDFIVGPAVSTAYDLESKFAIYPRIIFDFKSLKSSDDKQNLQEFKDREVIVEDIDGIWYLDYLKYLCVYRNDGKIIKEVIPKCQQWAANKIKVLTEKENFKLLVKYKWLHHYLSNFLQRN